MNAATRRMPPSLSLAQPQPQSPPTRANASAEPIGTATVTATAPPIDLPHPAAPSAPTVGAVASTAAANDAPAPAAPAAASIDADAATDTGAASAASAQTSASPSLVNTAPASAIVLEHISVRYQGAPVLRDVSARFACGQRWAIVGANGCGKSTLLKAAMRLLHCEAGQVHWQHLRRADIAYLPQQAGIDRQLPVRVQDLVALGLWHELRWWRGVNALQWARVHAALDQVGLLAQAREPIAALSSGQFQRVLFARMLVQGARMLLLDEPFNAVDASTTAELLQLLHGCARQGAGIVAVVHDHEQARCHFDHILRLDQTLDQTLDPSAAPLPDADADANINTAAQAAHARSRPIHPFAQQGQDRS